MLPQPFYFSLQDIHFILLHMRNCNPFSTRHLFNEVTVPSLIIYPFDLYIVICFCVQCNADVCVTTRTEKYHYVLLTMRLLIQELKSSRRQLYGCHNGLVYLYGISVSQITTAMLKQNTVTYITAMTMREC
jgi:hypothetical protein